MQSSPSAMCPFQLKLLFEVAKESLQAGAPLTTLEKIKLTGALYMLGLCSNLKLSLRHSSLKIRKSAAAASSKETVVQKGRKLCAR